MPYYSVLEVTPTSNEWIDAYLADSIRLVSKHGGKYLARTSKHERIEGQGNDPALRIILEWPSRQAALDFMKDPEYVPHLNARTRGSISQHVLISGSDDAKQ
jgi:uncharacterized protein (DUF1330 family)